MNLFKQFAIIIVLILFSSLAVAHEEAKTIQQFFGTVTINGQPAADNTGITARIGTTVKGAALTKNGRYSMNVSEGVDGDIVDFYVAGAKVASSTFQDDANTEVNLVATIEKTQTGSEVYIIAGVLVLLVAAYFVMRKK